MEEQLMMQDLEVMSTARNYIDWISSFIKPHLGKKILEFGAGIGNYTGRFLKADRLVVLEINSFCFQKLHQKYHAYPNVQLFQAELHDLIEQGYFEEKMDTVVCLNVLEHVEDDARMLNDFSQVLAPGGKLILMVPSYKALYGELDKQIGHFRRYGLRELTQKVLNAGFKFERKFYMNSLGAIGWFVNYRLLKRATQSEKQVQFYDQYVIPVISKIERIVPPPFGQSLFAICLKN